MHKNLLTAILVLCISTTATYAQTVYMQTDKGVIIDSATFARMSADVYEKMKRSFPDKKIKIDDQRKELRRNEDSIIYSFAFDIKIGNAKAANKGLKEYHLLNKVLPLPVLSTLDNTTIKPEDLKGKPTLLNFWFTACKPCIDEMPVLNDLQLRLKDQVNFIAINFESDEKVKKFLEKNPFQFMQVANAKKLTDALKIKSFPTNIFLDANGVVRKVAHGIPYEQTENKTLQMGDGKEFEATLLALLKEMDSAPSQKN